MCRKETKNGERQQYTKEKGTGAQRTYFVIHECIEVYMSVSVSAQNFRFQTKK